MGTHRMKNRWRDVRTPNPSLITPKTVAVAVVLRLTLISSTFTTTTTTTNSLFLYSCVLIYSVAFSLRSAECHIVRLIT